MKTARGIQKELGHWGDALAAFWDRTIRAPARLRAYDKTRDAVLNIQNGDMDLGARVAIFLVYQPNGLAPSVLETIDYLDGQGVSVVLVSNGGLTQEDVTQLLPHVALLVQRPNFGYDFGGYRDGVHVLRKQLASLESLVFLNDSMWFPLDPSRDLDLPGPQEGAVIKGFLKGVKFADQKRKGDRKDFVESYFLAFSSDVLRSASFLTFWDRVLLVSDLKKTVLKTGERGLSAFFKKQGVAVQAEASYQSFIASLKDLNAQDLRRMLTYSAVMREALNREIQAHEAAFEPTEAWQEKARDLIAQVVRRQRFNSAFVYHACANLRLNFLKKQETEEFQKMRAEFCRAVVQGDLPKPPNAIWEEISRNDRR